MPVVLAEVGAVTLAFALCWIPVALYSGSQRLGLGHHTRAVHHEQHLLRNRCLTALVAANVCVRKVKQAKQLAEIVPANLAVYGAPVIGDIVDIQAWATLGAVQMTRGGQQGVAPGLNRQAATAHAPEQPV